MARKREHMHAMSLNLTPLERVAALYYADLYREPQSRIIRGILHRYMEVDPDLDVEAFRQYLREKILPTLKDDPDRVEALKLQADTFFARRKEIWKGEISV